MARTDYLGRRGAERRFPYRVDIGVPPLGLGGRLSAMLRWCRENVQAEAWDMHWAAVIPPDYVRFYFIDEVDAEAFRRRWVRRDRRRRPSGS
jgi:hypothetical protein